MSFPNSPTGGTTHTIGDITWEYNGYAWEVIVSTIGGVSGPQGATGATGPRGTTGDKVGGFTISANGLLRYDILTWDDVVLFSGVAVGNVRGATGPTGSAGAYAGVLSLNGLSGDVTLLGGTSISISSGPAGITISYTGAAGSGNTGATGATGNPSGLYRRFITTDANATGITIGEIRVAGQTPTLYTFFIAQNSVQNISEKAYIDTWDDSTSTVKSYINIKNKSGAVYGIGSFNTVFEQSSGGVTYYNLQLNRLTPGVTFSVLEDLFIDFFRTGDRGSTGFTGPTGPTGPIGPIGKVSGVPYNFSTTTSDPASVPFTPDVKGQLRFNNISGATFVWLTDFSNANVGVSGYINTFDDSTSTHKGYLHISGTGSDKLVILNVTGITWFSGGSDMFFTYPDYFRITTTGSYTGGTFANNQEVYVSFIRTGDKGSTGEDGAPGSGGGAAGTKTYAVFTPLDNEPPASDYATIDTVNSISVLDFDGTTQESAIFRSMIPEGASFSNILATLYFTASTVTGGVMWGVQYEKLIGAGITGDRFTGGVTGLATLSGATSTPVGITLLSTSYGGLTVGDPYRVKVYRDAANASDSMAGDAELLIVEIRGA